MFIVVFPSRSQMTGFFVCNSSHRRKKKQRVPTITIKYTWAHMRLITTFDFLCDQFDMQHFSLSTLTAFFPLLLLLF